MNLSYICIIAALVSLVTAAPAVFGNSGATNGVFGQGNNLVSNIFDDAACIVNSVIGGANPRCKPGIIPPRN